MNQAVLFIFFIIQKTNHLVIHIFNSDWLGGPSCTPKLLAVFGCSSSTASEPLQCLGPFAFFLGSAGWSWRLSPGIGKSGIFRRFCFWTSVSFTSLAAKKCKDISKFFSFLGGGRRFFFVKCRTRLSVTFGAPGSVDLGWSWPWARNYNSGHGLWTKDDAPAIDIDETWMFSWTFPRAEDAWLAEGHAPLCCRESHRFHFDNDLMFIVPEKNVRWGLACSIRRLVADAHLEQCQLVFRTTANFWTVGEAALDEARKTDEKTPFCVQILRPILVGTNHPGISQKHHVNRSYIDVPHLRGYVWFSVFGEDELNSS